MAAEALEQSVLESKDKDQLLAIAKALGLKATTRTKKSDIIGAILDTTGGSTASAPTDGAAPATAPEPDVVAETLPFTADETPASGGNGTSDAAPADAPDEAAAEPAPAAAAATATAAPEAGVVVGPDGEPLAEWEIDLVGDGEPVDTPAASNGQVAPAASQDGPRPNGQSPAQSGAAQPASTQPGTMQPGTMQPGAMQQGAGGTSGEGEGESRNRRRRRRRKGNKNADGPQGDDTAVEESTDEPQPTGNEPVPVSGYLDMRDEGYGFLRVKGYLPSRDDAYIPVKLARQYGLRKGDHITGTSRPAGRNEKNPALLEVLTVNGGDPEAARRRPRFEDLTALFPDENLRLEDPSDPTNMTARIIDLVSPIGKGQRGIIVSPPKAGKTTIMKTIAKSIEQNNPEVKLIVLLIDERPEEVTDIKRTVRGEVIASTFDRPSDEHTHVAELTIEKAKRLVEAGEDVVVILDGITRLSRAYNLAAPASGRILSGGIDAGALYPPKKFFGAARNVEEGGSLTILATALVDTNSRMDEAIFEEFKGTGNMELRLDRRLAERRVYPAIDVDASSTRHEELLFDRKQLQMVWKLRRVLSGLAADGNAAPGLELLIDRLKTFRTNAEFLNEIAKQPSM
ncbi:transcription termination factor Rho [Desertimonas flava]|uniref:transcription termination factor Rho n=3 Tax=Desertimonas flava TaxID=2064846 RepID=UPI0023F59499|nr:transcription termination factor Rho [Desertimonas flava]